MFVWGRVVFDSHLRPSFPAYIDHCGGWSEAIYGTRWHWEVMVPQAFGG